MQVAHRVKPLVDPYATENEAAPSQNEVLYSSLFAELVTIINNTVFYHFFFTQF